MILIWLVTLMAVGVHCDHYTLDYNCTNGGIVVQNPDVGILKSATAGTDEIICNVTASADSSIFTISGCEKGEDIQFTLSTRSGDETRGDGIIGGSYSETYVLQCGEIDAEGVIFNSSLSADIMNGEVTGSTQSTHATGASSTGNATGSGSTTIGNQGISSTLATSTDTSSTSVIGLFLNRKKRNTDN